jgi:CrcB protein
MLALGSTFTFLDEMAKYLLVMLGGALGAVSRFALGTLVGKWYSALFPLGTFLINVTGSFLIGVLMMLFLNRPSIHVNWRLFLVTGILGGYTTFSSFEWEALSTLRGGASTIALFYLFLSVGLGLGGAWIGAIFSSYFWPRS